MPNHVINEINFRKINLAEQEDILNKIRNAEGFVDFGVLVPMPLNIWRGGISNKHKKAFGEDRCWNLWSRNNWGTKWNAYDSSVVQEETSLTIRFKTAWNPPYRWLIALFNSTKRDFEHLYMAEGDCKGMIGAWRHSDGGLWTEMEATGTSKQRHLHKLLYGVEEFKEDEDAAKY